MHVLEACRATPSVRAVVVVTTDKVYADREWPWPYREDDRLGGVDPYSASKACTEIVTNVYQNTLARNDRRIHIATARGGNVIGGGDWSEDRIVPDIVRAITAGAPITLRNPAAVRTWPEQRMTGFGRKTLPDADLDALVAYLQAMADTPGAAE